MSQLTVEVHRRETRGKNAARRMRAQGLLPAVVYGGGKEAVPIEIHRRTLVDLMRHGGDNAVFLLKLGDGKGQRHAMIREMQVDPVNRQILHIDFQRVLLDEVVQVQVAVELVGTALGVKNEGGMLDFITRELTVECLPTVIPGQLAFDVSGLHIGDHVEAGDVELPEGVTLREDPHRVIASVTHARVELEVPEEEEALIEAEAEEPEVIGRGKEEGEEEGAEG